jgi:hypothetical protein
MISIFPLRTFHLYVGAFQQHLPYGVNISQLIRYSRACGSYHDFLDRVVLLTRKLLNQGFLVVKLKSSLREFYGRYHDLVNHYRVSVSQMTMDMSACRNHNPVLSSFMTYHQVSNKSNTTGARNCLPFWSTPVFSGVHVARSLVFCVMFCRWLFVLLSFFFGHCVVCPSSSYSF